MKACVSCLQHVDFRNGCIHGKVELAIGKANKPIIVSVLVGHFDDVGSSRVECAVLKDETGTVQVPVIVNKHRRQCFACLNIERNVGELQVRVPLPFDAVVAENANDCLVSNTQERHRNGGRM